MCGIFLSLIALTTSVSYRVARATSVEEESANHRQARTKPPQLPDDPDKHVDNFLSHKIKNFVRDSLSGQFEEAKGFYVLSKVDDRCKVMISVVKKTFGVAKKLDGDSPNGFIVALLTNPNKCEPDAFKLDSRDTAAWYVRYENQSTVDTPGVRQPAVGRSGLILLHRHWYNRDSWFPVDRKKWALGYCNHEPAIPEKDDAMVMTYAKACDYPMEVKHNVDTIAAHQFVEATALFKARSDKKPLPARVLVPDDDIALWFACGGDCCYASFQQRR